MKNLLLVSLLLVSVGANVWFLTRAPAPPNSASALSSATDAGGKTSTPTDQRNTPLAGVAPSASKAAAAGAAGPVPVGLVWKQPRTDEDYRQLAAALRTAGFPSRLIYVALSELYLREKRADSPLGRAPFWQQFAVAQSAEMRTFERTQQARIEELLGPDGRPSVQLTAVNRKRRYGSLSDAKIDAIAGIERDYLEIESDVNRGTSFSLEAYATQRQQSHLLDAEKSADLAKILTASELAEYRLLNSLAGRQTALLARDVALTADEFAAMTRAREELERTNPASANFDPERMRHYQVAQAAYYEQLRAAVPDDRFHALIERADQNYRVLAALRDQFPSVTPARAYDALRLRNEVQSAVTVLLRDRPSPERVQAAFAEWNARLDTLLGPDAAAAYRRNAAGRIFSAPGSTSRGTPPNAPRN